MKRLLMVPLFAAALASCAADEPRDAAVALTSGITVANMDTSVRPQDDFYRYVNGAWLETAEIPGDRTSWGGFVILGDESEINQRRIVEDVASRDDLVEGTEAQKVGDMFGSFMNAEAANALGAQPVLPFLDRVAGIENASDFMTFAGAMSEYSVSTPLGIGIQQDLGDNTRHLPLVIQSGLGLPNRDYYLNEGENYDVIRAAYPDYLNTLFTLAGVEGDANAVYEFERELALIQWPAEELRDIQRMYNVLNVADLPDEVTRAFDWGAMLGAAHLENADEIIVTQVDYVRALTELLNETDVETLRSYYSARILDGFSGFLSEDFVNASQDFNGATVRGRQELPARWQRGVRLVNGNIGEAVGKVYVEEYFPEEAKTRMEVLVDNLLTAFGESIDELGWMSEETKALAQDKRLRFTTKIGYPDEWRDYSELHIERNDLFGNVVRARQFEHMRQVRKLGEPVDRTEWGMTPQTVNAYHNPTLNEIVFPAAILQPPFFNMEAEDAVNYGGIGAVIGHEIGHAFDDQGRRFDGGGELNDWWTEEDGAAFDAAANQLVAQYDEFEALPGLNVNGQLTLGENIGDLTGATIGWRAYLTSLNGAEPLAIDGFTAQERYLIGFAQIWRNLSTDEALRGRVLSNPHSPSSFRANGTLMNLPLFMETYGVQEGDGMWRAPGDRVKIW